MGNKEIIYSYLDALLTLTNASAVNLGFPNDYALNTAYSFCFQGIGFLPEFDEKQGQIDFPATDGSRNNSLVILKGRKENSILINIRLSAPDSLNFSSTNNYTNSRDRREPVNSGENVAVTFWLGFDFDCAGPDWLAPGGLSLAEPSDSQHYELFESLLHLGVLLLDHIEITTKLLTDPLTLFPGRAKFQNELAQLIAQYSNVALLLINPTDFQQINKKFGHACGDKVMCEVAQILASNLRATDLISRFGGTLFAIATPVNSAEEVHKLAHKLQSQLQKPLYLDGATNIEMNIGASMLAVEATNKPLPELVAELVDQADLALSSAQTESQSNFVIWHPEQHEKYQQQGDHIGGIFTADTAIDYRNMLLLWDISNLIASCNQFESLLTKVLQRLAKTFPISGGGILECDDKENIALKLMFNMRDEGEVCRLDTPSSEFKTMLLDTISNVCQHKRLYKRISDNTVVYAVPIYEPLGGVFVITGKADILELTSESQLLIAALAKQLGRALARARLEELQNKQLISQKQELQAELDELKQSVKSSCLYYCSKPMQTLMKLAQRIAMTDATTLIIGESGTGKERLVHAMHQMGNRSKEPLVIVDCSAISETLVESELFGHVKGAYTGAQNNTKGRIIEAAGGTLMLDEIGELPLQVQSKLLRFVQEKQFMPVGGNKVINVDIKIIAATNRELLNEVHKGRFRADLFYRLNVLELHVPPLRDRPDDIPLLVKLFLKKFSKQFGEPLKTISAQAMTAMLQYRWPGNVRELENRLMQVTLLCDGAEIEISDLNINNNEINTNFEARGNEPTPDKLTEPKPDDEAIRQNSAQIAPDSKIYLQELKATLSLHIRQIVHLSMATRAPLGRWLYDDLIAATYYACGQNARQAALRLGLPYSTLRRRMNKIENQHSNATTQRIGGWQSIMASLTPIVEGEISFGDDSFRQLKLILLSCIVEIVPDNVTIASALLGVSEPTFYKWKKELTECQDGNTETCPI